MQYLVPWPGIEPRPPALGVWNLSHRITREILLLLEGKKVTFSWAVAEGSSVQFSHSVVSDSLWSHGLQHARLPCPSLSSGVHSNSCPLSRWCHPTISSSVAPFSSCPQSFPASGSFPVSQLFASGSQRISPSNEYSGLIFFRINWFDLLTVQGTLKSLLQNHNLKASILQHSALFMAQLSYPYVTSSKWENHSFDYTDLCQQGDVFAF